MRSPPSTGTARRRLIVVSGYANNTLTPRGQRTQRLLDSLAENWEVELIAMADKPSSARPGGSSTRRAAIRHLAGRIVFAVLFDRFELWSVRRFWRWRPKADAALLIASPWSPVIYASRHLVRAGIPYALDVGDPWVLTADDDELTTPAWRARRAERFLWEHARGAVVTTRAQLEPLHTLFPELPMLIRPNGYKPVTSMAPAPRRDPDCLRLAHFGRLAAGRSGVVPFLADLWESGRWKSIFFSQFGDDFGAGLNRVPDGVRVEHREPRPWDEVIECAEEFDAALVVAYPLPRLLPSKAVEYSTLPLPRIAVTNPQPDDALREYAGKRQGWIAVSNGEPDLSRRVFEHVEHPWSAAELTPPAEDAWPLVAARITEFVNERVGAVPAPRKETAPH